MESHSFTLKQSRNISYRCAIVAVVALILLIADWLYLISTGSGGGILLPVAHFEASPVGVFDYIDHSGNERVEFGSNASLAQAGLTATDLDGNAVFYRSSYLLAERFITPRWAGTQTSKYVWAEVSALGAKPIHPRELPTQFIPLVRQLVDQQGPEGSGLINLAIDDTLSNTVSAIGIVHNAFASCLAAVVVLGCICFVYLFNKSRG